MKMTPENRSYFTNKLHKLADEFNRTTGKRVHERRPATQTEKEADRKRIRKVEDLIDKFHSLGYSRRQWNRLLETSGVRAKMDIYGLGGAYFIPSQKFLRDFAKERPQTPNRKC